MRITSWLNSLSRNLVPSRNQRRLKVARPRQAELLEQRTLLTTISYESTSQHLEVAVSNSESITIQTTNDQFEVLIDGIQMGPTPGDDIVQTILVNGGTGGNTIDLSGIDGTVAQYIYVTVHGGDGDDDITGSASSEQLYGEAGADVINGGAGDDYIYGGSENDNLSGGAGSDWVYGDGENDDLWSGSGVPDGGLAQLDGGGR